MCAEGAHFDTRSVRSVFCDAHVAAENLLYFFFRCGEKTLRGFVYSLRRQCAELRTAVGNTWRNRSGLCSDETSPLDMKINKKPATQMSYRFMVDDTRLELVTSRTSSGCATSCANRPALSSKKDYITRLSDCQAFSSRKPDFFRLRKKVDLYLIPLWSDTKERHRSFPTKKFSDKWGTLCVEPLYKAKPSQSPAVTALPEGEPSGDAYCFKEKQVFDTKTTSAAGRRSSRFNRENQALR